jgi:hypothetical protein
VKYLLSAATRRIRWLILRERLGALRYGYDAAELFLTLHYTAWAFVMWMPGEATLRAPAWHYLRQIGMNDLGNGLLYTLLAVPLWLAVLRLLPTTAHLITLWATLCLSVGIAAFLLLGNPLAVSAYDSIITAVICWLVFLRADRSDP